MAIYACGEPWSRVTGVIEEAKLAEKEPHPEVEKLYAREPMLRIEGSIQLREKNGGSPAILEKKRLRVMLEYLIADARINNERPERAWIIRLAQLDGELTDGDSNTPDFKEI